MKNRMCILVTVLIAGILHSGCVTPAEAQNVTCATRPAGDSSNACASTAFVQNTLSPYVVGPASATDNAVARFDGTTGKLIQNSIPTVSDNGGYSSVITINTTTQGIYTEQLSQGTPVSTNLFGWAHNHHYVLRSKVDVSGLSAPIANGLLVDVYPGDGSKGNVVGITGAVLIPTGVTPDFTTATDVVGVLGYGSSKIEMGGTNTGAGAKGGIFGVHAFANAGPAATNLLGLIGQETDVYTETGSTMARRIGHVVVDLNSQVRGATYDAAYAVTASGASPAGFLNGLLFSDSSGSHGIAATGSLIATQGAHTVTNGVDIQSYTYTGFAFRSTGFGVGGTGVITSGTASVQNGALVLSSSNGVNATTIVNNTGSAAFNYVLPATAGSAGDIQLSGGGGSNPMTWGTRAGNTTVFATTSGTLTSGRCVEFDASSNLVQSAKACNAEVGTVTSVSFTGGLISVATATTTPALTVAGTSGGIPYFSSGTTWATSAALTANALVIGGGAGVAPSTTTTGAGVLTWLGTPSSANLAAALTDETGGSGVAVFNAGPTFTGQVIFAAGSVGTPSWTLGDSKTGFYRTAANQIGMAISGANFMTCSTNCTFQGQVRATAIGVNGTSAFLISPSSGVLNISDSSTTAFTQLNFGDATSSVPGIRRSTTIMQARLGDNSAFTVLQAILRTDTAYTAGVPVVTGYMQIQDSTGTLYKLPACTGC